MTPLTSAFVLIALAIAVIALFAWRLSRVAPSDPATLPEPAPAPRPTALDGALIAGD